MKATIFSLTLLIVTGCSTLSPTLLANQPTQATKPQTAKLDTPLLAQASPSPQASQPSLTDRQNQIYNWGYNEGSGDGKGDGKISFPASLIGIESHSLTDPAEKKIYTDAYNRGYADGKAQLPSPSPTSTVSPARRTELQQQGKQDGINDAQLGSSFAANPGRGIEVLQLKDQTEIQIYTAAYNAAYSAASQQPTPTPTTAPGQLAQLRQQGNQDGYADAQSNLPKVASSTSNFQGLVTAAEQRAYTNGYNYGYQRYIDERDSIVGGW